MPPFLYNYTGTEIIFPKDGKANGTWIVLKKNGDALCLLNGAFQKYEHNESYTTSRGEIVLSLSQNDNIITAFEHINLLTVAPFTLIIINNAALYECRWDAVKKYCKKLNSSIPQIWSSATLYNLQQQQLRNIWFKTWLKKTENITTKNIIAFHTNAGKEYAEAPLIMSEHNIYSTVSITSIDVNENEYSMFYKDLINHDSCTKITIKKLLLCK